MPSFLMEECEQSNPEKPTWVTSIDGFHDELVYLVPYSRMIPTDEIVGGKLPES